MQRLPKKTIRQRDFMFRAAGLVISFSLYTCGRDIDLVWPEAVFANRVLACFLFASAFRQLAVVSEETFLLGFVRDHVRCLVR